MELELSQVSDESACTSDDDCNVFEHVFNMRLNMFLICDE